MDHQEQTASKIASSEGFVRNGIHLGFIAHVWEKRIVEDAGTVETNVGHHEHDQRPYPTRRHTEVGREGKEDTRDRAQDGEDFQPPQLDHPSVSDDPQRRGTNGHEKGTDHHGCRVHGVRCPLTAQKFG